MEGKNLLQRAWGAVFLILVVAIGARVIWSLLGPLLPTILLILAMLFVAKFLVGKGIKFR